MSAQGIRTGGAAFVLAVLLAAAPLAAQSDTTIRIDVRVRGAAPVHDTVVRTVTLPAPPAIHDTVTRTVQLPAPPAVHDTVKVPAWTQYFFWRPRVVDGFVLYDFASNNNDPTAPAAFKLPAARVDTVTLPVIHDTLTIIKRDTVRLPPVVVTTPTATGVELPRASVDTRMPNTPMSGDTLYACTAQGCKCKGPTCAATATQPGRVILP